jgi:hypothetical protein
MKTSLVARLGVGALALLMIAAADHARAGAFEYLGQQIVPSGTMFGGTTVGGLSGIDFVTGTGSYVAISDDRSFNQPARTYGLSLDLAAFSRSATPGSAGVSFNSVTTIQKPDGSAFATNTVDPESLRFDARRGTLYWSNEGQRSAAGFQAPTVREMRLDGSAVRDFAVPTRYLPSGSNGGGTVGDKGVYNNLAFESLTLSTDGNTLYTATENALAQDGPPASSTAGSPSRILSFDIASGQAGAEYVYDVSQVALPANPAGGFATNGLTDLLAVGDRQFIAIERSFAVGAQTPGSGPNGVPTGNTIRLYYVDARQATDVSAFDSLVGQSYTAASKTLMLDLSTLKNDDGSALALDNIEGLTLGPAWQGKQTLMLVSDNNFSGSQFTQFVALSLTSPIPEPASAALLLPGLLLLVLRKKRLA